MNMRNPKKPQIERMASVELKKTLSVMKCFICNQMFYSQVNFDDHMKLHSAKLSKNAPEEIQRKTMESFRMKKGSTAVQNGNKEKDLLLAGQRRGLNQTATVIRSKVQEKPKKDDEQQKQIKMQRQELKQAEQSLRKSTILIEKLQTLIEQKPDPKQAQSTITIQTKAVDQDVQQSEFLQKFIVMPANKIDQLCQFVQRTYFANKCLQSYQDQLKYLSELQSYLQKDSASTDRTKIQKIKSQIITDMHAYVKQNAEISPIKIQAKQDQNCNENCLYLTNIKPTATQKENNQKPTKLVSENVEIVQNCELCYCSECYMVIQYGEDCYRQTKRIIKANEDKNEAAQYHLECWEQMQSKHNNDNDKDNDNDN